MAYQDFIRQICVAAIPLLFALVYAEVARGYVANYLGDKTAAFVGRLTLDPSKHIDPINTLLLPLAVYFFTGGLAFVGGAKPILINYRNFTNFKQAVVLIAVARPVAHLIQAVMWMILFLLCKNFDVHSFFIQMSEVGITVNAMLFAFVLLPLPPYDGSVIVSSLLPLDLARKYASLAPYSLFIILALIASGILINYWLLPISSAVEYFLKLLFSPFLLSI